MQIVGMGHLEQVYNCICYIIMRVSKYLTHSNRHISPYYTKTFLPCFNKRLRHPAVCLYWPTFTLNTLQSWNLFCQPWPVWIAFFHQIFSLPIRLTFTVLTSKAQFLTSESGQPLLSPPHIPLICKRDLDVESEVSVMYLNKRKSVSKSVNAGCRFF
jgi:hypothetical protein